MKQLIKNNPYNLIIAVLGAGIIVAAILIMALIHDMSWQSYVVIGCLMIAAIWATFYVPLAVKYVASRRRISRNVQQH